MFCPKCGTRVEDNARFCNNCGNALTLQTATYPAPANPAPANPVSAEPATPPEPFAADSTAPVDANPAPSAPYAPYFAAPTYAPYPTEAPKKSKKKLWLIIGGAAVLVAAVALVLILVLGGGSPTGVVENFADASMESDIKTQMQCLGFDYMEYYRIEFEDSYSDVDEVIDVWNEYVLEYYFQEVDVDESKWEKRLKKVDDWEDFIDFYADFSKTCEKAYNEENKVSWKLENLEAEELTSDSDVNAAKDRVERWFDSNDDYESAFLFAQNDVKGYYLVTGDFLYEEDGEEDENEVSVLVVETSKGYFIIDSDWTP